jgi:Gas vesicle synthesis protein GvpL/GvpF
MPAADPLYLYAVCQLPSGGLTLPLGIAGELQLVQLEDIGAIAEPGLDLEALQADDQRLLTAVLTHDQVIVDLFAQTTLLPLRFGIQLAAAAQVELHLRDRLSSYRQKLAAVAGKAEYQIKLTPTAPELPPLPPELGGREYFAAKKARLQAQAAEQQAQETELAQLLQLAQAAFPNLAASTPEGDSPRLYLLLETSQAEGLLQAAHTWQQLCPHWRLALSQPLPPYHFVG